MVLIEIVNVMECLLLARDFRQVREVEPLTAFTTQLQAQLSGSQ